MFVRIAGFVCLFVMVGITVGRFATDSRSASPRVASVVPMRADGLLDLTLEMPGGESRSFRLNHVPGLVGSSYEGSDGAGATIAFTRIGPALSGSVTAPDGHFDLSGADGRIHVRRADYGYAEADDMLRAPVGAAAVTKAKATLAGPAEPHLDVLVVYDPRIEAAAAPYFLLTAAADAQNYLNLVFENSDLTVKPRLVGLEPLDVGLGDVYDLFDALVQMDGQCENPPDCEAVAARVAELREAYRADLVQYWGTTTSSSVSGYATVFNGPDDEFSAERRTSAAAADADDAGVWHIRSTTVAHEIGHNLGAGHTRSEPPGWKSYSYAYQCGTGRTAVANDCPLGTCTQSADVYSNPNFIFDGAACGVPIGDPLEADNASTAREALDTVTGTSTEVVSAGSVGFSMGLPAFLREPDSGTGDTVTLQLSRSGTVDAAGEVDIVYFKTDDPAAYRGDTGYGLFYDQRKRISFEAGERTKDVQLSIPYDGGVAGQTVDGFVSAQLMFPTGFDLDANSGSTALWVDSDHARGVISMDADNLSVSEGQAAYLTVNRSVSACPSVPCYQGYAAFRISTKDGTAGADSDYVPVTADVSVPTRSDNGAPAPQQYTFNVQTVDNETVDGDRTFQVRVESPEVAGGIQVLTITIRDDEAPVGLIRMKNTSASVNEGSPVTVALERVEGTYGELSVKVRAAVAGGDTAQTADFAAGDVTVTFADGETAKSMSIATTQDGDEEASETFTVSLVGATATAPKSMAVTIKDDDGESGGGSGGSLSPALLGLLALAALRRRQWPACGNLPSTGSRD